MQLDVPKGISESVSRNEFARICIEINNLGIDPSLVHFLHLAKCPIPES